MLDTTYMATIRDIKKRIKSVTNTKKVTHAMELVSAAKMRKAQSAALASRPYSYNLHDILKIVSASPNVTHPLLTPKTEGRDYILLITSDRGLAGGLNINMFRDILRHELKNTAFITVGKKALNFATKTNAELIASFGSEEVPYFDLARTLTKLATDALTNGNAKTVTAVYSKYVSTVNQVPTWQKILPVDLEQSEDQNQTGENNLLFEPTLAEIVNVIIPHHVLTTIYQLLLESKASEHSARMVAMKNATDAADDLIDDLTITYNQARQEAITKELLDIVTAQKAFE